MSYNMYAYCGNNPVNLIDSEGTRYCAATTVDGESAYDRFISCDFQKTVTLEKHGVVVDLTDEINQFMLDNLEKLREYKSKNGYIESLWYFYENMYDGGTLDIKLQDEWKFETGKIYLYSGMVLRYDDPGNINFGFLGAELFWCPILCLGAGLNQLNKKNVPHGDIFSCFDDPRDNYMIKYGYNLYRRMQ